MLYVIVTWDLVRERFVNSRFYCTVKHVLLCDNIRSYTFPKCCSLYWKVFSFISLEAVAKKLHVNLSKVIVYNCCPAVFSLGGISRRGMTKISLTHRCLVLYNLSMYVCVQTRIRAVCWIILLYLKWSLYGDLNCPNWMNVSPFCRKTRYAYIKMFCILQMSAGHLLMLLFSILEVAGQRVFEIPTLLPGIYCPGWLNCWKVSCIWLVKR